MSRLPKALEVLIESFARLPGVGSRTAERYAMSLLKDEHGNGTKLAQSIIDLKPGIAYCEKTFALTEPDEKLSSLYTDPSRDKKVIAVVAQPLDVISLENIGNYKGTYHVLGGLISPLDGVGPERLTISQLISRIKDDGAEEVILALNASVGFAQIRIGDSARHVLSLANKDMYRRKCSK